MSAQEQTQGRTVTVELDARRVDWRVGRGVTIAGYGFNGDVPGPTIEASMGDTLVVRLTNSLPEPTTIHWHGLRVPANMDGTEMVQHPVQPGETFEYRFLLPDAGTFWYHPHTNETEQLEKGLYGALIVRGADEPRLDAEKVLILDDLKVDSKGRLASFGGWKQRHEGRLGEVRLVNGTAEPELTVAAGQVERWRMVNASSSRYVRLSIGRRPFTILGTDGGLLEVPVTVSEVLLTPGDRVDLAIGPFSEGEVISLDSLPYDRGMVKEDEARYASVRVSAAAPSQAQLPAKLRSIQTLVTGDFVPNRTVHLQGRPSLRRGVSWRIDGSEHQQAEPVHVGELQVWDVVNETKMNHPFHLHGFFFQVLEVNGTPPPFRSWEDTVNVPAKGMIRIAWMPDNRPGEWMYHCHILEHHAAGMMAHSACSRPEPARRPAHIRPDTTTGIINGAVVLREGATVTGDVISQNGPGGARRDDRWRDTPAYRRTSPGKTLAGRADSPGGRPFRCRLGLVLLWLIGHGASRLQEVGQTGIGPSILWRLVLLFGLPILAISRTGERACGTRVSL